MDAALNSPRLPIQTAAFAVSGALLLWGAVDRTVQLLIVLLLLGAFAATALWLWRSQQAGQLLALPGAPSLLGLVGLLHLSMLWAVNPFFGSAETAVYAGGAALYLIGGTVSERYGEAASRSVQVALAIGTLLGWDQFLMSGQSMLQGRPGGTMDYVNTYAALAAAAWLLSLANRSERYGWFWHWTVPAVLVAGVALSGSRGTYLALPVAIGALLLLLPAGERGRWGRRMVATAAAGVVLAVTLVLFQQLTLPIAQQAGETRYVQVIPLAEFRGVVGERLAGGHSVMARLYYWQAALKAVAERPFLGYGPNGFAQVHQAYRHPAHYATDPHNAYLDFAVVAGLPGAILFLAFVGSLGTAVWRARTSLSPQAQALAGAVALLLVHAAIDLDLDVPAAAWVLLLLSGLLAGAALRGGLAAQSGRTRAFAGLAVAALLLAALVPAVRWYLADRAVLAGARLYRQGKPAEAEAQIARAERLAGPHGPIAAWSSHLAAAKDPAAAEAVLRQALQQEPFNAGLRLQLALLLARQGDVAGALSEAKTVQSAAPYQVEGRFARTRVLTAANQGDEAVKALLLAADGWQPASPNEARVASEAANQVAKLIGDEHRMAGAIKDMAKRWAQQAPQS